MSELPDNIEAAIANMRAQHAEGRLQAVAIATVTDEPQGFCQFQVVKTEESDQVKFRAETQLIGILTRLIANLSRNGMRLGL